MREVKKRKQKLQGKFKNTPSHTSLVACTVSPLLNRDQSLSVKGKVRTCNNLEVNLRQPTGGLKDRLLVYVRSVDGKPLMPCTPTKARHLLKAGRAMHLSLTQKKHNNRCIQTNRKGYRPSIRRQRSTIQPNDLFWVDGKKYTSRGMFSYGKYILYGDANQGEYVKTESVESFFSNNTWQFNTHLKEGVFLPRQG